MQLYKAHHNYIYYVHAAMQIIDRLTAGRFDPKFEGRNLCQLYV